MWNDGFQKAQDWYLTTGNDKTGIIIPQCDTTIQEQILMMVPCDLTSPFPRELSTGTVQNTITLLLQYVEMFGVSSPIPISTY